jgi:hypothetical protein
MISTCLQNQRPHRTMSAAQLQVLQGESTGEKVVAVYVEGVTEEDGSAAEGDAWRRG